MIIGHKKIIKSLSGAAESDSLAHAYIFSGSESIGKMAVALEFAKSLQCVNKKSSQGGSYNFSYCDVCKDCYDIDRESHPDLSIIRPEDQDISISQIRELIRGSSFTNYSAPYKIVIIDEAEKMATASASALLKTLEEPTPSSVLILITSYVDSLLDTIKSRCQQIKFAPVAYHELEKGLLDYSKSDSSVSADIPEVTRMACGIPGIAIRTLRDTDFKEKREDASRQFFNLTKSSLSSRYKYIDSFMIKDNVDEILNNWLHLLNDLLHVRFNGSLFIVNKNMHKDLSDLAQAYPLRKILLIMNKIKEMKFLLRTTNVNKKLALEVLMLEL